MLSLDLERIFSLNYLFNLSPPPFLLNVFKFLVILFAVFLLFSATAKILVLKEKKLLIKKLFQKISSFFLILGIIGFLLIFFRQQQVYFLSSPFLLLLWFIGFLTWLYFLLKYLFKKFPKEKSKLQERKEKEKYLPR